MDNYLVENLLTTGGKIFLIIMAGWCLGYVYRGREVRKLKRQKRALQSIPEVELSTENGKLVARYEEWPRDAMEYLVGHGVYPEEGLCDWNGFEAIDHLNQFAVLMTTRQKRDFIKMLKELGATETLNRIQDGRDKNKSA